MGHSTKNAEKNFLQKEPSLGKLIGTPLSQRAFAEVLELVFQKYS